VGDQIFISYAREDQAYTRKLVEELNRRGFETWIDDRIDYGDRWWRTIVKAIRNSAAFVVVMTPASDKSKWVDREVMLADAEGKPIFPLLLRGEVFPLFITAQYVDVTSGQLPPESFYTRLGGITPPQPREDKKVAPAPRPKPASTRLPGGLLAGIAVFSVLAVIIGLLAFFAGRGGSSGEEVDPAAIAAIVANITAEAAKGIAQPKVDLEDTVATAVAATEQARELAVTRTSTSVPSPTNTLKPPTNTPEPPPTPVGLPTYTPPPDSLPSTITAADDVPMVLVPAGPFTMGSDADEALAECQKFRSDCQRSWFEDAEPVHEVTLDAFYIDRYEVTNARYADCVAAGNCTLPASGCTGRYEDPNKVDHPVECVNWEQANTYCEWRGDRLPTEAEWEKAARGTDGRMFPWGENITCQLANYLRVCESDTMPVGSYPEGVSPYGAADMAGNVVEWVADWKAEDYYATAPSHNPQGPNDGEIKVLRGGSWNSIGYYARSAYRSGTRPGYPSVSFGFRCVSAAPE
jgi:formylglycine-generating enzyme required for sulfatase activity